MRQWYALRSKPKRESTAIAMLARAEIETYLPMVASTTGFPGRRAEMVPFFPTYFFARLDVCLGEVHMVRYTQGVLDIVGYGGEPCAVPDELIGLIKERVARFQCSGHRMGFSRGDRVVITNGPLQGTEAIFDRQLSSAGRAQVLVQILHRLCRTDVDVNQLSLFGKVAGTSRA